MKKRMYYSLCLASAALVLLTVCLSLWSVYGLLVRQAKGDLVQEHTLLARSIEFNGGDAPAYLESLELKFSSFRATLIAPDGEVLFDTDNRSGEMENHLARPEVAQAIQTGTGADTRHSRTMGMDTYYYAERLADGSILRASNQMRSIGAVFLSVTPLMVLILAAVLLSSMMIASRVTRRMLSPIEQLAENIGNTEMLSGYEELEPFFVKIREQNELIARQIEHLREERDTIRAITSNMKEGLVLLGMEREMLSVNPSAITLLGANREDYTGRHLLVLSRSAPLSECVGKALAGEGADAIIQCAGRDCHLYASPVRGDGRLCGAILLIMDVTEQQQAERIRREFTANVSHELKTPLTSISGFAEMIENGMVSNEVDIQKFAGRIYREASRLITLTDDIIRLARIEEDAQTDAQTVDLESLIRKAAQSFTFLAEQRQVALTCQTEPISIRADARMLDELVRNLTDNAIKYNRPDGTVTLSLRAEGDRAVISVADTGIGIPKSHQERIFERFYRVDKSRSKQTGGTGLGLSIVKHIVERHGGTLTLESIPGQGTIVTARLPLAPDSPATKS